MRNKGFHIRFGVGTPQGLRSTVWRLWTGGGSDSDVYIAPRSAAGEFKVSLHQSGRWQVSFTSQYFRDVANEIDTLPNSRHLDIWSNSLNINLELTLALRIIIPVSELRVAPFLPKKSKPIKWVNVPPLEYVSELAVIFTKPQYQVDGWPGKHDMNTQLVACAPLPNGEFIWVVNREEKMREAMIHQISLLHSKSEITLERHQFVGDLDSSNRRVLIGGKDIDGSRYLLEIAE
jgi:hypothetical protein